MLTYVSVDCTTLPPMVFLRWRASRSSKKSLIMESISAESQDEVKTEAVYEIWHANKDLEKLWQALENTHIVISVSAVIEMVELAAR